MTYNVKRVEGVKHIRAQLGLGLKESVDLYEMFDGDVEAAIAKQRAFRQVPPRKYAALSLIIGYEVQSPKYPVFDGVHKVIDEFMQKRLAEDADAVVRELVRKEDAENALNLMASRVGI